MYLQYTEMKTVCPFNIQVGKSPHVGLGVLASLYVADLFIIHGFSVGTDFNAHGVFYIYFDMGNYIFVTQSNLIFNL